MEDTPREPWEKRVGRIWEAKADSEAVGNWIIQSVPQAHGLGVQVVSCHNRLEFRRALVPGQESRWFLQRGIHCQRPLLCRVCAMRFGAARLRELVPRFRLLGLRFNYLFTFGTLTSPHRRVEPERLGAVVDELLGCVRRWWMQSRPGKNRKRNALSAVDGMYTKVEVTWSTQESRQAACRKYGHNEYCGCEVEGGWYHPHIHPVFVSREPLDFGALGESWRKVGGGHCKFRMFRSSYQFMRGMIGPAEFGGENGLVKDLLEVTKYTTKFKGMPYERIWEVFTTLGNGKRVKLHATRGNVRMKERPVEFEDAGQPAWKKIPYEYLVCMRFKVSDENPLGFYERGQENVAMVSGSGGEE